MDGRVDMILDGGPCTIGLESTIVKLSEDGSATLLRPGAITPEDIEAVIGAPVTIADAVLSSLRPGEVVLSPGMKYKHYAPKIPFFLLDGSADASFRYLSGISGHYALLCYEEDISLFSALCGADPIALGSREDLAPLAAGLFSVLRECDKRGYDAIYAPLPMPKGLGLALYNRMIRAAAHHIITL
jgi:L-threonylcarbamoyladenylate synthase